MKRSKSQARRDRARNRWRKKRRAILREFMRQWVTWGEVNVRTFVNEWNHVVHEFVPPGTAGATRFGDPPSPLFP